MRALLLAVLAVLRSVKSSAFHSHPLTRGEIDELTVFLTALSARQ